MKSVLFRNTGKLDNQGREVREPVFLSNRHTAHKSIFVNGDAAQGFDPDTEQHLDMGAFISIAPEAGSDPLKIVLT